MVNSFPVFDWSFNHYEREWSYISQDNHALRIHASIWIELDFYLFHVAYFSNDDFIGECRGHEHTLSAAKAAAQAARVSA